MLWHKDMGMKKSFQVRDICRVLDSRLDQVQYWLRHGVVAPEISGPTTRGVARHFSFKNVFELGLTARLAENGVTAKQIKDVLKLIPADFIKNLEIPPKPYVEIYNDLLLFHYNNGFFFANLIQLLTKGEDARFWRGEPPPELSEKLQYVSGIEKVLMILQYIPAVLIVNLEKVRRDLYGRVEKAE